jgi:hypothetical protein
MATIKKACKGVSYPKSSSVSKRLGSPSKAKSGGSFPDLNKDGKITKKDVLIGRGVLPKTAKKGMKIKKAQDGVKKLDKVKSEGNPSNPPLKNTYSTYSKNGPKVRYDFSADTTGFAAGKREFPSKTTNVRTGNTTEGIIGRKAVEYRMKNPNKLGFKAGGTIKKSMKKCAYGCK